MGADAINCSGGQDVEQESAGLDEGASFLPVAVGVHVAEQYLDPEAPTICLATAHPAKFGAAILEATGADLAHHPLLDALADLPTRCTTLPAASAAVRDFINAHAQ